MAPALEVLPLLRIEDVTQHALGVGRREHGSTIFERLEQAFPPDARHGAAAEQEVGSGHLQQAVEREGDVHPASISADGRPLVNRLARRSHWDVPCEGGRWSHPLLFDPAKSIWGQPPTPPPALGPASHYARSGAGRFRIGSMHSSNGAPPRIVFLVAEEVGDAPDEGYVKVVQ